MVDQDVTDEMRRIFDTEDDWSRFLEAFARAAEPR